MTNKVNRNRIINPAIWRYLVNFWTLFYYLVIAYDYYLHNELSEYLGPMGAIYIAVLAVYTAEKEFERWSNYHVGRHPGELYVLAWTIIIVILLVLQYLHTGEYKLPSEVFSTYIVVLGILAITKKSKSAHRCRKTIRK